MILIGNFVVRMTFNVMCSIQMDQSRKKAVCLMTLNDAILLFRIGQVL